MCVATHYMALFREEIRFLQRCTSIWSSSKKQTKGKKKKRRKLQKASLGPRPVAPGFYSSSSQEALSNSLIGLQHVWSPFSLNWSSGKQKATNESVVLSLLTASRGDLLGRWLHCDQVPLRRHNQQKGISRPLHQHQVPGHTALTQVTSGGQKGPCRAKGQTEGPPREAPARRSDPFGQQNESDTTEQPQDHQPHLSS